MEVLETVVTEGGEEELCGVAVQVEGVGGIRVAGGEGGVVCGEGTSATRTEVGGVCVDVIYDVVEGGEVDVIVRCVEVEDQSRINGGIGVVWRRIDVS